MAGTGKVERKRNFRKEVERGDITVAAAVAALKEEIIQEVRHISGGYKQSVFELEQKGKELLALEQMLSETATKKKAPKKVAAAAGGGIKAVANEDDEEFDDIEDGDF